MMKVHVIVFTLLGLMPLLLCQPVTLKRSQYTFRGMDDGERVCLFENLIMFQGRFFYLTDEQIELPSIPAFRPGPWKVDRIHIEVVNIKQLVKVIHAAAPPPLPPVYLRWSALVHRVNTFNFGYHLLDETPNLHRMLCRTIPSLCTYDPDVLARTWLIFYDRRDHQATKFNKIWSCFTRNRPIYAHKPKDDMHDRVVILETAVVGWQWGSLVHDFGWPPEFAGAWLRRLWSCMRLDRDLTVNDLSRQRVTLIKREQAKFPFQVAPIVERMRKLYPTVAWHAVDVDLLTAEECAEVFHTSSVIVNLNGALLGPMLFMRKGSVLVELIPLKEYVGMAFAAELNTKTFLKVTTRTYTRQHSPHRSTQWESLPSRTANATSASVDADGGGTSPAVQRQNHYCPADLASHCKGHVIYLRHNVKVTSEMLQRVMLDGLALLADVNEGLALNSSVIW